MNFISCRASGADQRLLSDFPQDPQYLNLVSSLAATAMGISDQCSVPSLAISGSQGTGKSTLAQALQILLREQYGKQAVIFSLDDFYLTLAERQQLGEKIHPLLKTRGAPGTHDLELMQRTLTALRAGGPAELPVFDKSRDDRVEITRSITSVDLIICEGWCWGARPEEGESLKVPINILEDERDKGGYWRHYVNHRLGDYQSLFDQDFKVFLQVPSLDQVFLWRWRQEQDLARKLGSAYTMNQSQVREFIQFYERLTSWMLEDMPARSDLTVTLNKEHSIARVTPLGERVNSNLSSPDQDRK